MHVALDSLAMPTEEKPKQPEKKEIKVSEIPMTVPDPTPSIYSNYAAVNATQWDVRFHFAEVMVIGDKPKVELRTTVVMNPGHAKAFADVLQKYLGDREKAEKGK